MREILFRGQIRRYGQFVFLNGDKVPGKWVYGGIFQGSGDFSVIYGGEKEDFTGADLAKFPVYSDTVGQFTGLTDMNGRRIFEGDLITLYRNKEVGVIEWCKDDARFHLCYGGSDIPESYGFDVISGHECEVIGNIYDNPELMICKQKKE